VQESASETAIQHQEWYDFRGVTYRSEQMAGCYVAASQLQEWCQFIRNSPSDQGDTEDGVVYDASNSPRDRTQNKVSSGSFPAKSKPGETSIGGKARNMTS
jgi:hypothetical protein